MNKVFLLFGLIIIFNCCQNETKSKQPTTDLNTTTTVIQDSIESAIDSLRKPFFNGIGVAIVDSSGVLFQQGYGLANIHSNTPYTVNIIQPIASVSKTFIGVALMLAQEKGLLQLDDPINSYLPFKVINPNFPDNVITIRQLATHTSTLRDTEEYMNRSYILAEELDSSVVNFENIPQSFNPNSTSIAFSEFLKNYLSEDGIWYNKESFTNQKPGQLYEYTNVGATVAAYIIELVSKQSFEEFTSQHILDPLKMNNSGWNYEAIDQTKTSQLYNNKTTVIPRYSLITYPDGGFLTTISDLSIYLNELIKGYSGSGKLLQKSSYNELFRKQLEAENFEDRDPNHPYKDDYNTGIFIGFSALENIGHTGGDPGVSSLLFFNAESKIGRILLVNTDIENQEGVNAYYNIYNTLEELGNIFK